MAEQDQSVFIGEIAARVHIQDNGQTTDILVSEHKPSCDRRRNPGSQCTCGLIPPGANTSDPT